MVEYYSNQSLGRVEYVVVSTGFRINVRSVLNFFNSYVEIKCQLNAAEVFIADLLLAQHVSGTTMPIVRS